ncbi:ribonuclease H-like domain-containing protein [Tanacetum coccineum]|uniref:Ribonuclease H-like domain-containing protein n=1 Tax=Tanacetum coccineum TaxID=301880 RepID=A0ABQ5HHC3_9ASTR
MENSKKRITTGKDCVVRILPTYLLQKAAVKKERKARTILPMAIPKEHLEDFHGIDRFWKLMVLKYPLRMQITKFPNSDLSPYKSSTNKVKSGHTGAYSTYIPSTSSKNIPEREVPAGFANEERDSFYQDQGAGKKEQNQNCLLTMMMVLSIKEMRASEERSREQIMHSWQSAQKEVEVSLCMTSNSKVGLGYEIQSNNEVLSYEEEMNRTVLSKKGPQKPETSVSDDKFNETSVTSSEEVVSEPKPKEAGTWHMTGNKDHLDDFEECKGGSVTFGGSKGYITGKGRIRVLFTKTECLVVSPDFKMPDENQILLKVPRQHNMYSFDMKTPSLTKDYAFLIAKATSDKSKLWHRRVKIIRSDNGTKFKNRDMLEFCGSKGIKQEYSNARTPQQNGIAKRMNRTLIKAARTILADSLLLTTFWAEAVSTACYIFNRVRVTKPQNKTPYELLFSHKPIISYIRPFGCHVTILDTLSVLGKFDGKCDEGFLVGYSLNSKAFRVYNLVTKKVEVNLHVKFLEEKPNVKGVGYRWMFDIDYLTDSMNYIPVCLENQTNPHAGTSEVTNIAGTLQTPNANASKEEDKAEELIIMPTAVRQVGPRKSSTNLKAWEFFTELQNLKTQEKGAYSTSISEDTPEILAFRRELDELAPKYLNEVPKNKATNMPELIIFNKPQKGIFDEASYDDEGMVHDFHNLPTEVVVSPIPTLRIHNSHPQSQILGDPKASV